jgi:hypothetical protein
LIESEEPGKQTNWTMKELIDCRDDLKQLASQMVLARVQAQGKNSGPASKARYFVLSAFAHERGILIGCLLLDSIIRLVIHHKGSR